MALNKDDIIRICNTLISELGISAQDIHIGAGAAMVLHGLRAETNDIDLCTTRLTTMARFCDSVNEQPRYFENYYSKGYYLRYNDEVELHLIPPGNRDDDYVIKDGLYCFSLEKLLEQKLAMNREKDQLDIKILESTLDEIYANSLHGTCSQFKAK